MNKAVLNYVLAGILAVLAIATWVLRRDFSQPNLEFMPEMVHSIPYDAFSKNPVFADGKTLQRPVDGTVARESEFLDFRPTETDAIRAGNELINPWSGQDVDKDRLMDARERGRRLYVAFCLPCHGPTGNGDGPVAKSGFPPPPSLLGENYFKEKLPDGRIFHLITFGQQYLKGKSMPAYRSQIAPEDRWKIILHIRSLQQPAILKAEEARKVAESIRAGKALYEKLGCAKCHPTEPGIKPVGPDLRKVAAVYTREQLLDSILKPSKLIAKGFDAQLFATIDGKMIKGFVVDENDETITLRDEKGDEQKIFVEDIEQRRTLKNSPMPEDLLKDVSPEQIEQLLDYIESIAEKSEVKTPQEKPGDGEVNKAKEDGDAK